MTETLHAVTERHTHLKAAQVPQEVTAPNFAPSPRSLRITFFQPPWADIHGCFDEMAKKQGYQPPLGVLYLASILKKKGHACSLVDAEAEGLTLDRQIPRIEALQPDLICITSTTPCYHKAAEFARAWKQLHPETVITIGGPHITVLAADGLYDCYDFGFVGEGEYNFPHFIDELLGERRFEQVAGLVWREDGAVRTNPRGGYVYNLDEFPFPDRSLLDHELYHCDVPHKGWVRFSTLITMRGCPFECVFCSEHVVNGRKLRLRSPKNIVDEMVECKRKYGVDHFVFVDSTLTIAKKHMLDLCAEIRRRRVKVTWEGWTRANLVDEDLLRTMKDAGLVRISFGIESGDPEILKIIKKQVSHNHIRAAYKLVKKLGIEATCSVMIGHPGETRKSVEATINLIRSIPEIRYSPLSISTPYPGTELYEMAKRGMHGLRLLTEDWSEYTRYDGAVCEVNDLTREDLIRLQKEGIMRIHFTPGRMLYHLRRTGLKNAMHNFRIIMRAIDAPSRLKQAAVALVK